MTRALYKSRYKSKELFLFQGEELLKRIKALLLFAPSKKETAASSYVERIQAALYPPDMTQEEVISEFGRLFMANSRDEYERRIAAKKKAKPKPSSTGGKKPPKKGDDDTSDTKPGEKTSPAK